MAKAKSTKRAKGVTRAKAVKKTVTVKDLPEKGKITRSGATAIRRRMP
jgi:hypothetical protein